MDDVVVLLLVRVEVLHERLGLGSGGELRQDAEDLTARDSADVDVVTKDGDISGGNRERNFGEGRVKRLNLDDSILLLVEAQGAQKALNFRLSVGRPNTDVVAMLVSDARVLRVKLGVNAVAVGIGGKELPGDGDWGGVGVLRVVNALGASESARRKFTCSDISAFLIVRPGEATYRGKLSPEHGQQPQ